MAEQFSIPTVGDLIADKYRVVEELGRGAYGVVFRADQEELGRSVAVKTLLPQAFLQQDIVQRFHREAQLISRLDHPNIIRLYDYGVDEGLLYMTVEYVEGRTLMDVIDNDAPLAAARVGDLALQILDALEHAHAQDIVHRDLKPENIVLLETRTSDGREYEVAKILDFGISKLLRGDEDQSALKSLTQDGTVLGTPHYMSPENIVGDPIDHRADIYAFGLILYEMLIGEHPFDAPSPSAVMVRHLRDEQPELPGAIADSPFGVAIDRCLQKQPWDRISSVRELIELLEAGDLDQLPTMARRPSQELRGRPVRAPRPSEADVTVNSPPETGRRPFLAAGVVVVLVLVAVLVSFQTWRTVGTSPDVEASPASEEASEERAETSPAAQEEPGPDSEPAIVRADAPDVGAMGQAVEGEADAGAVAVVLGAPNRETEDEEPAAGETPKARAEPERVERAKRPAARAAEEKENPVSEDVREVESVQLDISSIPTNASVTIDGVPVGSTPLQRGVPSEEPLEIRFSHIGYKEKVVRVTPSEETSAVTATLEKDHLRLVD